MSNQIKTIQLSTGTWVFVQTADYFYEESLSVDTEPDEHGNIWLSYMIPDGFGEKSEVIKLPAGHTYTLIGLAKDLTSDDWKNIVERFHPGGFGRSGEEWKDYNGSVLWKTALASGLSLLRSQGMDIETTVILKQK